ncbi:hypothetical protein AB838_16710 [Rhodobacteraceae bacterium (ex Bugula neritina AB1)]|nr:hypothetical protein AB838_16710 [Rhodobacteraceae bacterium (ex Bugula neritina AB1)]
MQDAELSERRGAFLEMIGGDGPEFDRANLVPDRSRYCMLVSDRDGFVIEAYAPSGDAADFQRAGIVSGGYWDERSAGTNGIDMALRTGQIMTVQGRDHFHACFHGFSCSSAPLHDARGELLGTITLVGSVNRRMDEVLWCEQMLRISSNRLQARLFRTLHGGNITANLVSQSSGGSSKFETMVACDEAGTIISSLPLSANRQLPSEHVNLEGRHLSELRDLTINVQGPALVLPSRTHRAPGARQDIPLRARPSHALSCIAAQGGGMEALVERARKLAAHRVPVLICGESGLEKAAFARAILDDLGLSSPAMHVVDGAEPGKSHAFAEALTHVRFLSEFPVRGLTPVLVIHNVDRLTPEAQSALSALLSAVAVTDDNHGIIGVRPVLIFSAGTEWRALQDNPAMHQDLVYLMGQSVQELPPIRHRDMNAVLDMALDTGVSLSDPARKALLCYHWPGNLREIRSVLREAMICGNGTRITLVDLPVRLTAPGEDKADRDRSTALAETLDSTGWNISKAAKLLGKSRATVNRWIIAEGLRRPE